MDARIADRVARFPAGPGVYVFTDARGDALYVGKAADLRARVKSYLKPGGDGRPQLRFLEHEAKDVEFVATATEQEALLLENTVIKKRKPRYNIKLKDDKAFLLLRLDSREDWPWYRLVRRRADDGALYFGPYASAKDREKFTELVDAFIDKAIEEDEPTDDHKFNKFYRLSLERLVEENVRNVFESSGSPIETIFLNSLILGFIKCDSLGLVVHPVQNDAEDEINNFINYFSKFKEFLEWYIERHKGYAGIDEYLDKQVKDKKMEKEEREYFHRLMFRYQYLPLEKSYHLTLQPPFPNIKIDNKSIRPDMLFWIPAKPEIKVIVECDGFDYHSDKQKFTSDRKRDRLLQAKGYQVLRYSGSEIY